jgi:hypothetical protein
MKLTKISQTNIRSHLTAFYVRKLAALADRLQQKLDSFSPREVTQGDGFKWAPPQDVGPGKFLVEISPTSQPGQEIVTVTQGEFTVDVNPEVALEMLQELPEYDPQGGTVDSWPIMQALIQAETASGLGSDHNEIPEEAAKGTPWEFDRFGRKAPLK